MPPLQLFIPGRLCLSGEHSDWASAYTPPGLALIATLPLGLYAEATRSRTLTLSSPLCGTQTFHPPYLPHAHSTSPWRFGAAVAHIINTRYTNVQAVNVTIVRETLPASRGLSSSAAICVLITRAFNKLHSLKLSAQGEMDVAYAAERLTGSMCGRMDQVVALGDGVCARMTFRGELVEQEVVQVGAPVYVVLADLGKGKDTKCILRCLNDGIFGENEQLRRLFGQGNLQLVGVMEEALRKGDARELGEAFDKAQAEFDRVAMPFCSELEAPGLHEALEDLEVRKLVFGGKGVGSQGDGAVQFIAKGEEEAEQLVKVLKGKLRTEPMIVPLGIAEKVQEENCPEGETINTAVIPAAGWGTRLYPASRHIRPKSLFPIVDNGVAKPVLLHLVEQSVKAGIEKVVVVVNPKDEEAVREVFMPVEEGLERALKEDKREYSKEIEKMGRVVEIRSQSEPKGFGHAVYCGNVRGAALILLGDIVFKGNGVEVVLREFEKDCTRSVLGVCRAEVEVATAYGVVQGEMEGERMKVVDIVEKPDLEMARKLSYEWEGERVCNIVVGPYALTKRAMYEIRKGVEGFKGEVGEIGLTPAVRKYMAVERIDAVVVEGAADMGDAAQYVQAMAKLGAK